MIEKRKHPFVIVGFTLSIVFFVTFLLLIFLKIYPDIVLIEWEKKEVSKMVEEYKSIKSNWITFDDFKSIRSQWWINLYLQNILNEVDYKFYNSYFINDKWWDFDSFFIKKVEEINSKKEWVAYKNSVDTYKKLLPSYVEVADTNEIWIMTDFKFVTYLESLLHSFNLESKDKSITLWNLNILPDYNANLWTSSWLDTTIFYIPYTFDIEWRKKDIIDFIYFLENVWSINYDDDTWKIEVNKDNFINKSLAWTTSSNILENPVVDIESITFPEYIDSWLYWANEIDFKNYIKNTQWDELFSTIINVRFYVKWLPNYKILESITKLIERYNSLKSDFTNSKKKLWNTINPNIDKGLKFLQELEPTIKNLKNPKIDLNSAYKQVIETNKLLDIIWNILKK